MSDYKPQSSSTTPSEDAMLGLERLVVGRECNGFDRLSPERKRRAFAELVRLGYAYGKVKDEDGNNLPVVSIERVSSRGRRLLSESRPTREEQKAKTSSIFWVFVVIVVTLLGCLYLFLKVSE